MLPIHQTSQQPSGSDSRGRGARKPAVRSTAFTCISPQGAGTHWEQSDSTTYRQGGRAQNSTVTLQLPITPGTTGGPVFMQRWRRCHYSRISFCLCGSAEGDGRCPWCWTWSQCRCRCPLCWTSRGTAAETETFQTHTFTIIPIFQKDYFDLNACIIFSPILCKIYQCFLSVARLHLWMGQKWESWERNTIKQHHKSGSLALFVNQAHNNWICTN